MDLDGVEVLVSPKGGYAGGKDARGGVMYKYRFFCQGVEFLVHSKPSAHIQPVRVRYGAESVQGHCNRFFDVHFGFVVPFLKKLGLAVTADKLSRVDNRSRSRAMSGGSARWRDGSERSDESSWTRSTSVYSWDSLSDDRHFDRAGRSAGSSSYENDSSVYGQADGYTEREYYEAYFEYEDEREREREEARAEWESYARELEAERERYRRARRQERDSRRESYNDGY